MPASNGVSNQREASRGRRDSQRVTSLLLKWRDGDADAMAEAIRLIYPQLRLVARSIISKRNDIRTIQATELIGEVYQQIAKAPVPADRIHLINLAGKMMREFVIEYSRAKHAQKRGGGWQPVDLVEVEGSLRPRVDPVELLALEESLSRFELRFPRPAKVVELRFHIGLSIQETAQFLGISPAAVKRDWVFARAWLHRVWKKPSRRPPRPQGGSTSH